MEDLIENICARVVANTESPLRKSASGTTTIMSISVDVRKVTDNLDSSLRKKSIARVKEAIKQFMEANYAVQFRQRKGNGRDLFTFAAEIHRPLHSIEAAADRLTFLPLDRMKAPRYGTMTTEDFSSVVHDVNGGLAKELNCGRDVSDLFALLELASAEKDPQEGVREVLKAYQAFTESKRAAENALLNDLGDNADWLSIISKSPDFEYTQSSTDKRRSASVYCKAVNECYVVKGAEKRTASDNVVAYATWAGRRINEERELLSELSMADQWDKLKDSLHTALVRDGFISVVHDPDGGEEPLSRYPWSQCHFPSPALPIAYGSENESYRRVEVERPAAERKAAAAQDFPDKWENYSSGPQSSIDIPNPFSVFGIEVPLSYDHCGLVAILAILTIALCVSPTAQRTFQLYAPSIRRMLNQLSRFVPLCIYVITYIDVIGGALEVSEKWKKGRKGRNTDDAHSG